MPTGIAYQANEEHRSLLEDGITLGVCLQRIAQRIGVSIPTLKRHYGNVIGRARLKRGPKVHVATDLEKEFVVKAAAVGVPQTDIAKRLKISKGTLRRYFGEELQLGRARANFTVGRKLLEMATGDPTLPTTATVAIWWSKVWMGWSAAGLRPPGRTAAGSGKTKVTLVISSPEDAPAWAARDLRNESDAAPTGAAKGGGGEEGVPGPDKAD